MTSRDIVIIGGARDYHAVDWYRAVKAASPERRVILLTDSITGEGFDYILREDDCIERLFVIDRFLFPYGCRAGDIWRNILKILVVPVQVFLLRRFAARNRNAVFHAHPMYYMFVCWMARVDCGVTPQGSEVLVRPQKSRLYRWALRKSLQAATFVTVDSHQMETGVKRVSGVDAYVVQNGVDTSRLLRESKKRTKDERDLVASIRGIAPLYRIAEIVDARNHACREQELVFAYPFADREYLDSVEESLLEGDCVLGRLNKDTLFDTLSQCFLVISIPTSDSSPRSVYEAIFAGAIVALVYNPFLELLPPCMRSRTIEVDLDDSLWFPNAVKTAKLKMHKEFQPSADAIEQFDELRSIARTTALIY